MYQQDGRYAISIVARLVDVHPQTLRQYERLGLVVPERTSGNIRQYSDRDVERLKFIQRIVSELGVNLAGVEIILNMRERILQLHNELEDLRRQINGVNGSQ
jgi:MerR family transcriptional regulator, heat shock protein HspR